MTSLRKDQIEIDASGIHRELKVQFASRSIQMFKDSYAMRKTFKEVKLRDCIAAARGFYHSVPIDRLASLEITSCDVKTLPVPCHSQIKA